MCKENLRFRTQSGFLSPFGEIYPKNLPRSGYTNLDRVKNPIEVKYRTVLFKLN